jgi:hypothetical protein
MTLRDYQQMVPKDLSYDKAGLDEESARTAQLHNKYLNFYIDEKGKLEDMERAFSTIWHTQSLYYLGKADPEVYKAKPFDLRVRPIKSELEQFLKADPDIQSADIEIKRQEKIVKYLNDQIAQINRRSYEITNMIGWRRFMSGLNN